MPPGAVKIGISNEKFDARDSIHFTTLPSCKMWNDEMYSGGSLRPE